MHGMTGGSKCKAVLLLVLGVLFLLNTLGVSWMEGFTFTKFWPLFLVLWGLHDAICKCGDKGACGCGKS